MTRLRQNNGDDYPAAARRHLEDAGVLHGGGRFDGTAYLAGYVVECALKTLIQIEAGGAAASHDLAGLDRTLGSLAARVGAQTARIYANARPLLGDPHVATWHPAMRYRDASASRADADAWIQTASAVYAAVVGGLTLDGAL